MRHDQSEALPSSGIEASSVWNFCACFSGIIAQETSGSISKCRLFSQAKEHILVGEIFYMGLSHLPLIFDFKNVGINCLAENGCPECASVSLPCTCLSSVSLNTKFTQENYQ